MTERASIDEIATLICQNTYPGQGGMLHGTLECAEAILKAGYIKASPGATEALELAARACEKQAEVFLSPEYATGQPLSSVQERFACAECAKAIRALAPVSGPATLVAHFGPGEDAMIASCYASHAEGEAEASTGGDYLAKPRATETFTVPLKHEGRGGFVDPSTGGAGGELNDAARVEAVERMTLRAESLERIGADQDAADLRLAVAALASAPSPTPGDAVFADLSRDDPAAFLRGTVAMLRRGEMPAPGTVFAGEWADRIEQAISLPPVLDPAFWTELEEVERAFAALNESEPPWFVGGPRGDGLVEIDDGRTDGLHSIWAEAHVAKAIVGAMNLLRKWLPALRSGAK